MKLIDLPMYLVGRRGAILRIASSRWALVVGVLLVFSGSLARNYDGAYLIKEWDVLLHGVGVSIANSFILFVIMYGATRRPVENRVPRAPNELDVQGGMHDEHVAWAPGAQRERFWSGYLSFLGLFWMSAPMAWLYGIPYERWLTPAGAVHANLNTLGLVSVWRVALMTRVLSVIFGARVLPTFFLVMLFSDIAVVVGAIVAPAPLIDFMGGMQHSPEVRALSDANMMTKVWGVVSFPVWLVGAICAIAVLRGNWCVEAPRWGRAPRGLFAIATLALVAWIVPMWWTQTEQRNRWEADALLRAGKIDEALTVMSTKGRAAYPPIWDPAPKLAYGENTPAIEEIASVILKHEPAAWVSRLFLTKSGRYLFMYYHGGWRQLQSIIENRPEATPSDDAALLARLRLHEKYGDSLTAEDRDLLEKGIKALEKRIMDPGREEPGH